MRVAWFHPTLSDRASAADDVPPLVHELRSTHEIDLIDERGAHEFLWRHARRPYDVCVYELADTTAHQYVWPYLLHVPGIVALRATSLRNSRSLALAHERRRDDYRVELAFTGRPMLRTPLAAARLVVVFDAAFARTLRDEYPDVRIAVAPIGVNPVEGGRPAHSGAEDPPANARNVRFGFVATADTDLVDRAARRARDAGVDLELIASGSAEAAARDADVVIALDWPPAGVASVTALVAMASARPSIVLETEAHAAWPALDPQTWQPRDRTGASAPAVVSLDPRDEEHSLVLATRRLSSDARLRGALGAAGQAWWREHGTIGHAASAWRHLLAEAAALPVPPRPPGWPAHLNADGTERAREILDQFGVGVDFLNS